MSQKEAMDQALKQFEKFVESIKQATGLPIVPDQKTGAALWVDQRELRLKYTISVERIKPFYDGLMDGKLVTTKCSKCGTMYFPPQSFCPKCRVSDMEWTELSMRGELLTFTVINIKPASFAHYEDYIVGIARLEEGINVTAWVREKDPRKLRIGMPVRIEIVKREPEGYFTYEIVPVKE